MKIILGERFLRTINDYNKDIKKRGANNIPLFVNNYSSKYMLDFKVTDLAKANTFITSLSNPEISAEIEDKFGIRITGVRYDTDVEDVKNILREALARLENM